MSASKSMSVDDLYSLVSKQGSLGRRLRWPIMDVKLRPQLIQCPSYSRPKYMLKGTKKNLNHKRLIPKSEPKYDLRRIF